MVSVGLFVRIEARPGREEEVQAAITAALKDVEQEPGTTVWLALRLGPTTFAVVDAFPDQEARQEHLEAGRALLARLPELLAQPPTIEYTDVLAAKISGSTC
ncbi:putative quinol monooxygenase [Streptomyces sp. NPDC015232]|uniref:putative quinol monooxygenase n=1 Tax=unclassified Streptomyces TaxID=2593676 RepID=UPI0036F7270F